MARSKLCLTASYSIYESCLDKYILEYVVKTYEDYEYI